jgi:hypothetical protein
MFDLSFDALVLLAHVTAGFYLVGGAFFAPHIRRAILGAPSVDALLAWLGFARKATAANPPVALALLASGIYLGSAGWWSTGWFYVALAAWVVNCVLAIGVIGRGASALAQAASRAPQGPVGADLDALRRSRAWDVAGQVMRANDIGMLYVMYVKPTVLEACLVIAVVLAVGFALHAGRARRQAPAAA